MNIRILTFNIGGVFFSAATVFIATSGIGDSWPVALLSVTFFLFGNLDKFESFKAGPSGVEAKIKEAIKVTEFQLREIKELAIILGTATINNLAMTGRMGGFSDVQKDEILGEILSYFKRIGIENEEKEKMLLLYYKAIEHDYRLYCTGGSQLPKNLPSGKSSEWHKLREGGITDVQGPDEIEKFLSDNDMLTEEFKERINDYRYFQKNKTHRRPEIWARRHIGGGA